ncbi:MAG: hypothetical protein QM572_07145 [Nocardioides sp.]|uniref:hypothetical protein n=1 Tax=Nocardioides sp. TaxID=35761 RepID=UPI0039E63658
MFEKIYRRRQRLSPEDAASRITAYVYGNILALSSLVPLTRDDAESGQSFWIVAGTSFAIFLAHALAESAGRRARTGATLTLRDLAEELRDSVPVLTSGLVPALILLAAWWGDVPGHLAQIAASGYVLVRLAVTGLVIGHMRGERPSPRTFLVGLLLAAAGTGITALKLAAGH